MDGIDDMFNFETFFSSFVLLFQISTSAGWNGVLNALMNDSPPDCDPNNKPHSNCGHATVAVAFLCSYLVLTFLGTVVASCTALSINYLHICIDSSVIITVFGMT